MPGQSRKLLPSCFSFPQGLERWLAVLPRPWLDRFELHAFPQLFSQEEFSEILKFWRNRRVAFVCQSACLNTYSPVPKKNWVEKAMTTQRHPGPLGLLADLKADFIVVRQDSDPETFAWRGKHLGDPDPEKTFQQMEIHIREQEQMSGVLACEEVYWEKYDLVVCLDIPVPSRITRRAPRTLWTYLSMEAGGPLQEGSLKKPVDGYHLFLNHHFRRFRVRPSDGPHVLDFPFAFQSQKSWQDLIAHLYFGSTSRAGILADRASASEIPEPKASDITIMGMDGKYLYLADMAHLYASHKYALRLDPRRRWGNWLVEVIQAGCLFLGRPDTLDNISPLLPGLAVRNYREAREKIEELEGNPELFAAYRNLQSAVTEHVAFRRPLADLTAHARRFFSR